MKMKETILGIVIAILLVLTIGYGINTFYESPKYENFCPNVYDKYDKVSCEEIGGVWMNNTIEKTEPRMDSCQIPTGCSENFEEVNEKYSRNLFLITLPLGILVIVLGAILFGLEFIEAGLMGGGVLTILYGVINYWRYSGDVLKFLLSFVGLVIVIWFGYWISKRENKK